MAYVTIPLIELFVEAQNGDDDAKVKIIEIFRPLIKKYGKLLNYECAETDLVIELLCLINSMKVKGNPNLSHNAQLISYTAASIKHKYTKLCAAKNSSIKCIQLELNLHCYQHEANTESWIIYKMLLEDIFATMNTTQQKVFILHYLYGMKPYEITKKIGISRQAVYKAKKKIVHKALLELT